MIGSQVTVWRNVLDREKETKFMIPKNFKDPAQVFRMAQAYAKRFAASVAGADVARTGDAATQEENSEGEMADEDMVPEDAEAELDEDGNPVKKNLNVKVKVVSGEDDEDAVEPTEEELKASMRNKSRKLIMQRWTDEGSDIQQFATAEEHMEWVANGRGAMSGGRSGDRSGNMKPAAEMTKDELMAKLFGGQTGGDR